MADVLDRVEAEADRLAGDDEAVVGGVDVGRQHLDAHLLAAVDEERHLVLGRHHRGDHRRHVLGRVVGLQVGGAVGDQRVTGRVGLVEGVVGRRGHQRPEVVGDAALGPRGGAALEELVLHRRHQVALLLADRLAQVVGLGRREAGDLLRDLHQLLLVDAAAVGRLGDRPQALVGVGDASRVALAPRVVGDVAHRARAGRARRARRCRRTRSA